MGMKEDINLVGDNYQWLGTSYDARSLTQVGTELLAS